MTRTKKIALTLVVVAMFATLALVVGCSGSSAGSASGSAAASAAAPTLESYVKEHAAEWDAKLAEQKEAAGDVMDVDVSVEGNTLTEIITLKKTYSGDSLTAIQSSLEGQKDSLASSLANEISGLESEIGANGIIYHVEYRNGDGTVLLAIDVSGK